MYFEFEGPQCSYIMSDTPFFEWTYMQKVAKDTGERKAIADKHDNIFGVILYDEMPTFSYTFEAGGRYPSNVVRAGTKLFIHPSFKHTISPKLLADIFGYGSEVFIIYDVGMKFDLHFISRHPNDHSIRGIYRKRGWEVDDPLLYQIGSNPDKASAWKHIYYRGIRSAWNPPSMTIEDFQRRFE